MKVTFKEPITVQSGVVYPAGYVVECDGLVNLQNGYTELLQLSPLRPGLNVLDSAMTIGARDLHKLEVKLEFPA